MRIFVHEYVDTYGSLVVIGQNRHMGETADLTHQDSKTGVSLVIYHDDATRNVNLNPQSHSNQSQGFVIIYYISRQGYKIMPSCFASQDPLFRYRAESSNTSCTWPTRYDRFRS